LVELDLALEFFFFAVSALVPKLPSNVEFIPNQCNMACYPADIIVGVYVTRTTQSLDIVGHEMDFASV
jgi:hypothetical protein